MGVLDLLLVLHADPAREWSRGELCRHLRCPAKWADQELLRLRDAGLVAGASGRFRFLRSSADAAAVDELARAWKRDQRRVTQLIFASIGQFAG